MESKSTPRDAAASPNKAPEQSKTEAEAIATEHDTDSTENGKVASELAPVVAETPQLSTDLLESAEVDEAIDVEQSTSTEEEQALQPPVVAAVEVEATTTPEADLAVENQPTTQERAPSSQEMPLEPTAAAKLAGGEQGDSDHQPKDQQQEPTGKTSSGEPDTPGPLTTGEPQSERQAAVPGSLTSPAEDPATAPSTLSHVASPELVPPVEEAATRTETIEPSQATDAPKEARPVTAPMSHRLNSTLLTGQQPPPAEAETRGQVDPSRFVNRVTRAFQAAEQRGGVVQLRLSPPELGAMRIELSVQQGVMSARLETETQAAKSVLLDNLPALRERLAAMDIRVDKFDVDVQQEGSSNRDHWQSEQQGGDRRQSRSPETAASPSRVTEPGMLSADDIPRPNLPLNGRLNVIA